MLRWNGLPIEHITHILLQVHMSVNKVIWALSHLISVFIISFCNNIAVLKVNNKVVNNISFVLQCYEMLFYYTLKEKKRGLTSFPDYSSSFLFFHFVFSFFKALTILLVRLSKSDACSVSSRRRRLVVLKQKGMHH